MSPRSTHRCPSVSVAVGTAVFLLTFSGAARADRPDLQGMWSDPPATPADYFCYFYCTDAGVEHLNGLLADPRNDSKSYSELSDEASRYQLFEFIRPRLTPAALEGFPRDPADDPGFLNCEPWGFARQIFAPHQLELTQYADRVEMRYGEWEARRTIHLDGRGPPAGSSRMGFSVGRYEGESLVVETTQVSPNLTRWGTVHGENLRAVETYTRSTDGERLFLTVVIEDPWGLVEPLELKKVWGWAPDQEIFPYEDCEPATEFSRGVG